MQQNLIVLTGATGFLGSRLLKKLQLEKFQVRVLVRPETDLRKLNSLSSLPPIIWNARKSQPETPVDQSIHTIIHCAAEYGFEKAGAEKLTETNLNFSRALFAWGTLSKMQRFVNAGTSLKPEVSPYAESKEAFREFLINQKSSEIVHLQLEHFYGPGDSAKKFVTWLICELLQNRSRIPLTLGEQIRDFIYVDDVINAFVHSLELKVESGFNQWHVRSPQSSSIRKIAELICELCGKNQNCLGFGDKIYRTQEQMQVEQNQRSFMQTGWTPNVSLREGLIKTIEFEDHKMKNWGDN